MGEPAQGPGQGDIGPGVRSGTTGGFQASSLLSRLLAVRGFAEAGRAQSFLDPKLTQLHDPSLIPDLDLAAERILLALSRDEQMVIYGDYDVDGITATAILYHTIKAISPAARVSTYVPHRLEEGYGLNPEAIGELASAGNTLIVSVDCGITAVASAEVTRERGVDLIITDHHTPPARMEDLPKAFAVVHPRRPDSKYPFGELCGAGVAYKLAWRLCTLSAGSSKLPVKLRELLVELLAFAGIGTIADIVPLVGENRVIARYGLVRVKHSPMVGLRALVEASGLGGEEIDAMGVGFRLGPRLNAAGRMGHAKAALELFTTATPERAGVIAQELSVQNQARRDVETGIFELACEMVEKAGMHESDRRAIVLAHETWHAGVVGIVCSRLVERYHRPTILMQTRDGHCHGSARSIDAFNLHGALKHCEEHLEKYGGHAMAAGLTLSEVKLPVFVDAFTEYANTAIAPEAMCASLTIDCQATAEELTAEVVKQLETMGPFGAGNPEPKMLLKGVTIAGKSLMGAKGKHLSVQLKTISGAGDVKVFRAVGWSWGRHFEQVSIGSRMDVVVKPRLSTFNGRTSVEPEICDMASSSER